MSYAFKIRTHCSRGIKEPFTLMLAFQFFILQSVCFSHSLSASFFVPQDPHLQTTLKQRGKESVMEFRLKPVTGSEELERD